jgi:hypothetical protein
MAVREALSSETMADVLLLAAETGTAGLTALLDGAQ